MCDHESEVKPEPGCADCDKIINRPIPRRYGQGGSSVVIPRPPEPEEPADEAQQDE